jgi:hypothetical protein
MTPTFHRDRSHFALRQLTTKGVNLDKSQKYKGDDGVDAEHGGLFFRLFGCSVVG